MSQLPSPRASQGSQLVRPPSVANCLPGSFLVWKKQVVHLDSEELAAFDSWLYPLLALSPSMVLPEQLTAEQAVLFAQCMCSGESCTLGFQLSVLLLKTN